MDSEEIRQLEDKFILSIQSISRQIQALDREETRIHNMDAALTAREKHLNDREYQISSKEKQQKEFDLYLEKKDDRLKLREREVTLGMEKVKGIAVEREALEERNREIASLASRVDKENSMLQERKRLLDQQAEKQKKDREQLAKYLSDTPQT